jgi:hypothetical protein
MKKIIILQIKVQEHIYPKLSSSICTFAKSYFSYCEVQFMDEFYFFCCTGIALSIITPVLDLDIE